MCGEKWRNLYRGARREAECRNYRASSLLVARRQLTGINVLRVALCATRHQAKAWYFSAAAARIDLLGRPAKCLLYSNGIKLAGINNDESASSLSWRY